MKKIAIITDTDSSISLEVAQANNIHLVPIMIQFGETSFRDVFDINNSDTFSRIDKEGKLPTTAAPSPGQFADVYKTAFDSGSDSVLCFTVSGEISATYSAALNACELLPGKDITVIDTKSLSMQQGFMALAASEAVSNGASKDEAITAALDVRDRSQLFAALDTLKYLAMSGRVGHLAAGMANMLNVKPILTIKDGKLEMLEKIRTKNKSWNRTIELANQNAKGRKIEKMCIVHVNVPDAASQFESILRTQIECPKEISFAELGPGLSIHSGVGMVGVVTVYSR